MNSNYPRIEDNSLSTITFASQVQKSLFPGAVLGAWLTLWMIDFPTLFYQALAIGKNIPLLDQWIAEAAILPVSFMIGRRLDNRRHLAVVGMIGVLVCAPLGVAHFLAGKDLEGWPISPLEFLFYWVLMLILMYLTLVIITAVLFVLRMLGRKLWGRLRKTSLAEKLLGDQT
ncbi:MAG TPA: hypothetical protein VK171_11395 [Fimbriimonas sp.]|nr:hypothetical protein [Fimbriimonas sp.]